MARTVARLMLVGVALVAGCATAPKTRSKQAKLERDAAEAVEAMINKDPSVKPLLEQSAGYIVFPEVKEGGFIVGGAGAQGVVFERGKPTGFARLNRASIGAQIGGQKYAELIAARDQITLDKIKSGDFDFGAEVSAVILRAGLASGTTFGQHGVAVVMDPIGGAMVNASVSGQRITTTTKI